MVLFWNTVISRDKGLSNKCKHTVLCRKREGEYKSVNITVHIDLRCLVSSGHVDFTVIFYFHFCLNCFSCVILPVPVPAVVSAHRLEAKEPPWEVQRLTQKVLLLSHPLFSHFQTADIHFHHQMLQGGIYHHEPHRANTWMGYCGIKQVIPYLWLSDCSQQHCASNLGSSPTTAHTPSQLRQVSHPVFDHIIGLHTLTTKSHSNVEAQWAQSTLVLEASTGNDAFESLFADYVPVIQSWSDTLSATGPAHAMRMDSSVSWDSPIH